ncbi:FAD-dependent oxidoreductase [Bradyrhizobium jicamae]|uniref:FAD-dependent oxidoreductase n=1 Tax=Bradyrhizobium jicamae TaxID=280332 RepID=A0ABS5FUL3_9BRAD|nr:FAD-dependent oxidoreductase [Bradyrhizobium jicamae]MBR0800425.1 FAD-dependent oxidoreductase [Bradyrhizobium jicamae]
MAETKHILIVGAGPVGLALAGELGWRGITCTVVEKSDGSIAQPKMDWLGTRTLEFCRRWDIVPWVHAAGYNRAYPQDCAYVSSLNGFEFGREVLPSAEKEEALPQSPAPRGERCPQNFFDPVLRRFASQFPSVKLRYQTELLGFEEHGDHITARVKDLRSNKEETIEAAYLIGCDGGGSSVRDAIGIKMEGPGTLTYTTNAIFRTEDLDALHDKSPAYRYIFIGPEGTWSTVVAINGRDEWRFSLVGDATRQMPSEEEMRAAIIKAVGREFKFEILSMLPWARRQLVAENYGRGRIYIAGDAAHLTSPTGGFGMNMGLQDAVDLGWKLEAALQGWAGPELLHSYGLERRPVAIRNVNEATDNLKRMLAPRLAKPGPEIFEPGAKGDAARKAFGDQYNEMMKREWYTVGIHLGFIYEGSPVIIPDGTPLPPDEVSTYTPTARPGSRAPHIWLAEGKSTLDLFGRGFVLLCFGGVNADELSKAAERHYVPMRLVMIDNSEARKLYERRFVLVRPDGHVAWRSDQAPDAREAERIVAIVRGANSAQQAA